MDNHGFYSAIEPLQVQSPLDLLGSLQARATALLAELIAFQECVLTQHKDKQLEIRQFRSNVQSEVKSLERIAESSLKGSDQLSEKAGDDEDQQTRQSHILRSSNLPFYEAVWNTAKSCRGVKALCKRMYWAPKEGTHTRKGRNKISMTGHAIEDGPDRKKRSVLVDIVANDGAEWIKVSTVTEKRLLFEMAKEGWEVYGPDSDSNSNASTDEEDNLPDQKAGNLELVKLAQDLQAASRCTRIHYHHPQITFVLPKIVEGKTAEIDGILADLRASGATVHCHPAVEEEEIFDGLQKSNFQKSDQQTCFQRMLPSLPPTFTPTLNIDCTILLALISDISHLSSATLLDHAPSTGGYHSAILRQIAWEEKSPLLPDELYPVLAARDMVCSSQAANRMREIVNTMGTADEKARASIILGEEDSANKGPEDLRVELRRVSTHLIPSDLKFPIRVISLPDNTLPSRSPVSQLDHSIAQRTATALRLSPINRSVFLDWWTADFVTVTSNRVVAADLEKTINAILDEDERNGVLDLEAERAFVGPKLWVCTTARSLVGKEKPSKKGKDCD